MTGVLVVAMIAAGVGGATAEPIQETGDDDRLQPVASDPTNGTTDEYRPTEPSGDWTDKPVDLETAPEDLSGAGGGAGATSDSGATTSANGSDHPLVGTTKQFLGSDLDAYYFKDFTLLAVEENVEVWVADDLSWPAGDPRVDPEITKAQAQAMAEEFDETIHPTESDVFGEPAARNGSEALLTEQGIVPEDYYVTGNGSDRTVLLVDNVRDENFYDPTYPLYIAGFYSPTIQDYTDRNAITVDAFDWNEINATNGQTGYEDTLAHEYQHLIHADLDGDETSWINEGMSDYAEVITGYGVPEGHLSAYEEMPSNSLINWEDQGAINVLADYGIAFAFTMYLEDQYGQEFISTLAADEANGIEGVENTLASVGADRDLYELYQDFSTAVVTDQYERPPKDEFHFDNLDVRVNTSGDVGTAGVWGTNYVEIDTESKGPIADVTVTGTDYIGTEWSVDTDPVSGEGDVLYSGSGNLLDHHAIVETDLSDVEDPTLSFDSYQEIEPNWDYGFVQVSTDGGETWESLANEHTDDSPAANAHPRVKTNVPGLTGPTDGWEHQEFDLSAYEGEEDVLVSFRYVTDWAVAEPGWWVKNVSVAGESVSTDSTDEFDSLREATGDNVEYQFTFVGVKHNGNFQTKQLDMRTFDESGEQELKQFLRNGNFEELIVAATWAAESGESGRVPVGVDVSYVHDDNPGQGNGNGSGPENGNGPGNGNGPS